MAGGARCSAFLLAVATTGAPSCGPEREPPTRAQAEELLRALDDAFSRGNAVDYGALFADDPCPGPALERMLRMLAHGKQLRQTSTLEEFSTLPDGRVGVALVSTTLACPKPTAPPPTALQSCIAFGDLGHGLRVLLYEDVDSEAWKRFPDRRTGQFYCPPCNFRVGSAELRDWLVVPSPRRVSGCVEMVSFHRPGEPIRMTVSVHTAPLRAGAQELLAGLLDDRRRELLPACAERGPVEAWLPPAVDGAARAELDGARSQLLRENGMHVLLHLLTRRATPQDGYPDGLCYLLTVTASTGALRAHRREVDAWLGSFVVIDPARAPQEVGREAARAHSGGELGDDGSYHNERYGVSCQGPQSWTGALQADGCLFGATWVCPAEGGVLQVGGHPYGPGSTTQRQENVLEIVRDRLRERGFEIVADTGWRAMSGPNGAQHTRELESVTHGDAGRRIDRLMLFPDLWILVDGEIRSDEARQAYRVLVDSLER